MPLLCISLFALLLLPLSLSCNSKRPHEEVRNYYMVFVKTYLDNTRENITTLVQTSSCLKLNPKLPNCASSPNISSVVSTLHSLTCKMENLGLPHTDRLVTSVLNSIHCSCVEKPTKEPSVKRRRRKTTRRQRSNEQKKNKRETRKLCKAMVILSAMTECYEMLNSLFVHT
uniref:Interleukin-7 n=1 Tax=Monopterus albus TaxID=43700 RepID=A0A3Q3IUG2_MONAL